MNDVVVDIENVIVEAVAGEIHDAQRLGPLIERALARVLEQEGASLDLAGISRRAVSSGRSPALQASEEGLAEQVARAILRALRR